MGGVVVDAGVAETSVGVGRAQASANPYNDIIPAMRDPEDDLLYARYLVPAVKDPQWLRPNQ